MKIVQLINYSRDNRTMTLAFNNAAYRYLFATLRGVLYKRKGTSVLTPSMGSKIRNCLAMFSIIYLLCRENKHILKYKFFSPITSSKNTINEYKKALIESGLVFVEDKTFAKTQNFDGTKDNPDFITNLYFLIPEWSYAVLKTENFNDNNWDYLNFSNLDESFFDFLENPDGEDKRRELKKIINSI